MKLELKVQGMTIDEWVVNETKEVTKTLWGDELTFTPVCCEQVIGDGLQLIYVGTTGQRPYHWLVRIDSGTDLNASDFEIDEILELIEDEFGKQDEYMSEEEFYQLSDEPGNDFDTYEEWLTHRYEYPSFGWDGGFYGTIVNMKK